MQQRRAVLGGSRRIGAQSSKSCYGQLRHHRLLDLNPARCPLSPHDLRVPSSRVLLVLTKSVVVIGNRSHGPVIEHWYSFDSNLLQLEKDF